MNIGLIIYGSLDILTGGFIYDRKVVEHLRACGHNVTVFSLPWRDYPRHLLNNFSNDLPNRILGAGLDILVQDELNHPSLFLLNRRLKPKIDFPIISIVHHLRCSELRPAWQNKIYARIEREYLKTADGFVCNSLTTLKTVEELGGAGKPWVVGYPGRDTKSRPLCQDSVCSRTASSGPLNVLFVGSLIPRKELHTLVRAISLLPKNTCRLNIVGAVDVDPAYSSRIQRMISDLGLSDQVELHGRAPHETLADHYGKSHVLCVPSSYEGFGIVYLEGMGHGLPAIASNTGAAHEIVKHGESGFLVTPGAVREIADLIHRLHTDRDKLQEMSICALQRNADHPTWRETTAEITDFLIKTANHPQREEYSDEPVRRAGN